MIETDLGPWQGMRVEEVAARFPEAYRAWRTAPTRARLPGIELVEALADRMAACAIEALARGGVTQPGLADDPGGDAGPAGPGRTEPGYVKNALSSRRSISRLASERSFTVSTVRQ